MKLLRAYWAARESREQRALATGAVILTCMLAYALILSPLLASVQHAEDRLPELRKQAALLGYLAKDVKRLQGMHGTIGARQADYLVAVTSIASLHGLNLTNVRLIGQGQIEVGLVGGAFPTVVDWLKELQSQHHLYIKTLEISQAGGGTVKLYAILSL